MKGLLTSAEAAKFLGYSSTRTLINSRHTGLLCGVKAPRHLKMGKTVRYDQAELESWLGQFQSHTSTADHSEVAA